MMHNKKRPLTTSATLDGAIDEMAAAKKRLRMSNPWHLLATGFGSGLCPYGPGTAGSVAAIPCWLVLTYLSLPMYLVVLVFSCCIGVYICHRTAKDMGAHDHGSIVWDEFVGMWITLLAIPVNSWRWVLIAFLLFRLFDIWKPWPISWLDRHVHGGLGIMLDDIVAGIFAALVIYLLGHYWLVGWF